MSHRLRYIFVTVVVLHVSGCALPTQKIVSKFVDTQKHVKFTANDFANPAKIVLGNAVVYYPRLPKKMNAEMKWLAYQAPIIVQGVQAPENKPYPPASDKIGMPILAASPLGSKETFTVNIDITRPTVFARLEKENIFGREITQLVYTHWYPDQPVGGIERGKIDSSVLRVTLDANQRPAVYEHVWACGCYHGAFVTDTVEAQAKREFGTKEKKKKYYVEKNVPGKDDWRIKDIVHTSQKVQRPILFISTGGHFIVALQTSVVVKNLDKLERRYYDLLPYSRLDHLPIVNRPSKTGSMFNRDRLVWGAIRKGEEHVFPAIDHPGWPRHLAVLKIHWDQELWNSPQLLTHFLRLPKLQFKPTVLKEK